MHLYLVRKNVQLNSCLFLPILLFGSHLLARLLEEHVGYSRGEVIIDIPPSPCAYPENTLDPTLSTSSSSDIPLTTGCTHDHDVTTNPPPSPDSISEACASHPRTGLKPDGHHNDPSNDLVSRSRCDQELTFAQFFLWDNVSFGTILHNGIRLQVEMYGPGMIESEVGEPVQGCPLPPSRTSSSQISSTETENCAVCLDPMPADPPATAYVHNTKFPNPESNHVTQLRCAHTFHYSCVVQWFKKRTYPICPICRGTAGDSTPSAERASSVSETTLYIALIVLSFLYFFARHYMH